MKEIGNDGREPSWLKVGDTNYLVMGRGDLNIYSSKVLTSWKFEDQYEHEDICGWKAEGDGSRIYSPEIRQFGGRFNFYYDTLKENNPACKV